MRSNATGGKGQRSRQPALPSQSLYALGAEHESKYGLRFLAVKIPDLRCISTSLTLQLPIKDQQAGTKTPALSAFSALSEPRATASRSRAALDKLIEEALASHVALLSRRSHLTLGLPNYQQ